MKKMNLPVLEEMGDIAPALDSLLQIQANYARSVPGVTRAMRDVARKAVAVEIQRYVEGCIQFKEREPSLFERVFGPSVPGL